MAEKAVVKALTDIRDVRPLSIAVYKANEYTSTGHVTFVEYVERDANGTPTYVYITESNGGNTLNKGEFNPNYDGIIQKIAYEDFIKKSNLIGYLVAVD